LNDINNSPNGEQPVVVVRFQFAMGFEIEKDSSRSLS
jgi:hypothetical protein